MSKSKGNFASPSARVVRARRPIDKALVNVIHNTINATQQTTTLITATFPCTITGIRWDINTVQNGGTAIASGRWAIVIIRDGATINTLTQSDGSDLYEPEQDVLAFGMWLIDNNTTTIQHIGATKTMRKLQGGDALKFLCIGVATETSSCHGVVQFFCKT